MTVACNPRTGECHYVNNRVTPRDQNKNLKNKLDNIKKSFLISTSNAEVQSTAEMEQKDNNLNLSGENLDNYNLQDVN